MGSRRKTGVEGVHIVSAKRAGKPILHYVYAWRGGPCIRKSEGGTKPTLTKDDIAAITRAYDAAKPIPKDTLRGLITEYRSDQNPDWARLQPTTQRLWRNCLDHIIEKWGEVPLRLWSDQRMVTKVVKWRDEMASKPRSADNHVSCLYRVLEYGRLRGRVTINVAGGIPTLYKGGNRAEIIWSEDDIQRFCAVASQPVADAVRLAAMTGLRRTDLVKLKLSEIGEFALIRVAQKMSRGKRRKVTLPIIPGLRALLDELATRRRRPGVETVLVNKDGNSFTPSGLNSSFYTARTLAGIVHIDDEGNERPKHLHDLRGTFATKLMTIPGYRLTDREIAEIMGWSEKQVAEIRRVYVDDAAIVVALGKRISGM